MHISTLELFYMYTEFHHASAKPVAVFRDVKYKG
jgi:hypothetical protein